MFALRPACLVTNTLYQCCCYFRDTQGAPAYLNDAVEAVRLLLATKQAKHGSSCTSAATLVSSMDGSSTHSHMPKIQGLLLRCA